MSVGLLTQEGLSATQEANSNNGWFIYPTKFLIADTYNIAGIVNSRDELSMQPTWYTGLLSGGTKISDTILQFNAYIPPNQNGGVSIDIAEIYLFAEGEKFVYTTNFGVSNTIFNIPSTLGAILANGKKVTFRFATGGSINVGLVAQQTYYVYKVSSTQIKVCLTYADAIAGTNFVTFSSNGTGTLYIQKEFMIGLAGTVPTSKYDPVNGASNLRIQIQLATAGDPSLFKFLYTQAAEISDHNLDPNAHPKIVAEMNNAGLFVDQVGFDYKGQNFDELPVFESGVVDGNAVYLKANGKYDKAKADGTIKELNFAGFRQDGLVKVSGFVNIGTHGFSVGSKVYLDPTTAGALTSTANNTEVGIVKSSTTILLTKHFIPTISLSSGVVVQDHGNPLGTATTFNATGRLKFTFGSPVATGTVSSPIDNINVTGVGTTTLYSPDVTPKNNFFANIAGSPASGDYVFTMANPVATDDYTFNISFDGQVRVNSNLVINLEATQDFDSLQIANATFSNTNSTVSFPCVINGTILQNVELRYVGSNKFVITNVNYAVLASNSLPDFISTAYPNSYYEFPTYHGIYTSDKRYFVGVNNYTVYLLNALGGGLYSTNNVEQKFNLQLIPDIASQSATLSAIVHNNEIIVLSIPIASGQNSAVRVYKCPISSDISNIANWTQVTFSGTAPVSGVSVNPNYYLREMIIGYGDSKVWILHANGAVGASNSLKGYTYNGSVLTHSVSLDLTSLSLPVNGGFVYVNSSGIYVVFNNSSNGNLQQVNVYDFSLNLIRQFRTSGFNSAVFTGFSVSDSYYALRSQITNSYVFAKL